MLELLYLLPTLLSDPFQQAPADPGAPAPPAATGSCPPGPPATIKVERLFTEPAIDFSRDSIQISAVTNGAVVAPLAPGERRNGATLSNQISRFDIDQAFETMPDGTVCGRVRGISGRFGFVGTKILVASELEQDECLKNEVLAHETRHVETVKAILDDYAPRMEAALTRVAAELNAVPGSSRWTLRMKIRTAVDAAQNEVMMAANEEHVRRQLALDTPEEYARVDASCGGRMAKTLKP